MRARLAGAAPRRDTSLRDPLRGSLREVSRMLTFDVLKSEIMRDHRRIPIYHRTESMETT